MEITSLEDMQHILCGFYELDAQGKILYARLNHDGKRGAADDSVIGRNLFEIFTCRNISALQQHFQSFVTGKLTTESFIFGGSFSEQMIPLRIMLVRVAENSGAARKHLFFLDIKPG